MSMPTTSSTTIKRQRQSSSSSSSSSTPTNTPSRSAKVTGTPKAQHHPAKASRIVSPFELSPPRAGGLAGTTATATTNDVSESGSVSSARHPMLCTLPPTCTHKPTPLANTKELEAHYATCHAHVCEQKGCGCVFPEARLLELHFTECHDPLAAVRKDRGEKIFACHLATCDRVFMTPKTRRLHLIQAHGYPKEYFFAVTNKGVGGLLRIWGEGASMIRKEWKPRAQQQKEGKDVEMEDEGDEGEEEESEEEEEEGRGGGGGRDSDDEVVYERPQSVTVSREETEEEEALTRQLNALSLVPQAVRFGRGGKRGMVKNTRGRGNVPLRGAGARAGARAAAGTRAVAAAAMEVDVPVTAPKTIDAGIRRGLGWRGRGRAGIMRGRRAGGG
ncbi:hypothetical protein AX17_002206 [Amanita inopinata Kibby_2008]|nr:hypothetical protein AX17_002206 [Amanita inopinata Kibby_2008]